MLDTDVDENSESDRELTHHLYGGDQSYRLKQEIVLGIAKVHAETSRKLFPGCQVRAITNGVHPHTWAAESFRRLYDTHLPGWCHEPELLVRADCCITTEAIWDAHSQAKQALVEQVRKLTRRRRRGCALHQARTGGAALVLR